MKNLDIKKLLVFLILIIAVVGGIFFITKHNKDKKIDESTEKESDEIIINYFANLTEGYSSPYAGLDVLYNNDKTTIDDLEYGAIINTAIKYANQNNINLSVSQNILNAIEKTNKYGKMSNYIAYNATELRKVVKDLFGEEKASGTYSNSLVFLYDFIYNDTFDVYLKKKNTNIEDHTNSKYFIDYSITKHEKDKDKIKTTLAIAYCYNDSGSYTYYSDSKNSNEIASGIKEFPKDKLDKFTKYTITLKHEDNKYIFESIEKVK
ncbi:MAG TPA: hypothetical protein DCE23_07680 [Firmicutes bacterium]|nr:hypothetical protein [Bacillota bacterium]